MAENEEIHSANITLTGADDTGQQVKIRDQNHQTYSFFKNKKDGGETEAYRSYQQFKIGDSVLLTFKEVPYKNGRLKNVMTFRQATGAPEAAPTTAAAQWKARSGVAPRPGREYWEKREARRESSILMQVAFKAAVAIEAAKIRSGGAEDRGWLYNTTLEFYYWLAGHVERAEEEQGGVKELSRTQKRSAAEEARDDEIIF